MTLEIIIMNPNTITLASDSAVTISNHKTYTGVKKLLKLSDEPPMGIMCYGSPIFGSVEFETIVGEFKKNTDFSKINNIKSIAKEFIKFTGQISYPDDVESFVNDELNIFKIEKELDFELMDESDFETYFDYNYKKDIFPFIQEQNISFNDIIPDFIEDKEEINKMLLTEFCESLYYEGMNIIIAGFDKQYNRPSYTHIGLIINNKGTVEHKCFELKENCDEPLIHSFAQDDDVNAFLEGISPEMEHAILNYLKDETGNLLNMFYKYLNEEKTLNEESLNELKSHIESFKNEYFLDIINSFEKRVKYLKEDNANLILNFIEYLPKLELANLAKFLIMITSLKKKYSFELESVSDPIDVCVISKVEYKWVNYEERV